MKCNSLSSKQNFLWLLFVLFIFFYHCVFFLLFGDEHIFVLTFTNNKHLLGHDLILFSSVLPSLAPTLSCPPCASALMPASAKAALSFFPPALTSVPTSVNAKAEKEKEDAVPYSLLLRRAVKVVKTGEGSKRKKKWERKKRDKGITNL